MEPQKGNWYEIQPRPVAVGEGWRLHLYERDPETGDAIEVSGGVFPVEAYLNPQGGLRNWRPKQPMPMQWRTLKNGWTQDWWSNLNEEAGSVLNALACGNLKVLAVGRCATCYTLKRQDEEYFGRLREAVLKQDGHRCRVCGNLGADGDLYPGPARRRAGAVTRALA